MVPQARVKLGLIVAAVSTLAIDGPHALANAGTKFGHS